MSATPEQFQAHHDAYLAWQAAGVAYWAMIEEIRAGRPVDPGHREHVLSVFDDTHKAWMRAGEPLTWPRRT